VVTVERSLQKSIKDGVVTKDMGGSARTEKVGSYIAKCVKKGK
jgi:isocitrate/isopropylmalate dehydrogenase